jgi:fatty-acyl-CoA synthase
MTHTNQSYFHRGGKTPLLGATIPEHITEIANRYPEMEAIVSIAQDKRLTYIQLEIKVDRLARALLAIGFNKGDRIGIWSTNNIEWLLVQLATARIGVILVNINPAYRVNELAYALKRSKVQGLFVIPDFRKSNYVASLIELIPELKDRACNDLTSDEFEHLRRVVIYNPDKPEDTEQPASGFTTWQDLLSHAKSVSMDKLNEVTASLDHDDPINIQYTSGTTGFPKPVLLTHHNILNNAYFAARAMRFSELDRLAVPVPFYHCFGMVLANLLCLSVGACIVIPGEHFDAGRVLHAVDTEGCTAVHGVPTMFIAELEHPDFETFDLSNLRTGIMAGAPCPPELMKRVMHDMHCPEILIGYGQTEVSPLTHLTECNDTLERRTETVGKNLSHQEVKIINTETGMTVPLETTGEICFRGYHLMRGYYGDEEATNKTIDEAGWLHSGDLGSMDSEGYVRITGRLKDLIIRGGENIYPREIEDLLYTHPKISEAAVFGIPDEFYGEEIAAWVLLVEDETATEEEIKTFCKDNLAHFKVPKTIRFVDEFPMTVTGKLQKFRMREIELEKSG